MTHILSAHKWPSNAELIRDALSLHAPTPERVLDLTYGRGVWWKQVELPRLDACLPTKSWKGRTPALFESRPGWRAFLDVDFRDPPPEIVDGGYDLTAFDPPYVSIGGRATSTAGEFNDRFGLDDTPATPLLLHEHNVLGLHAAVRATRPNGRIFVKVMNYISSGKRQPAARWMMAEAERIGLVELDTFYHVGNPGMQPLTDVCPACRGADAMIYSCVRCGGHGSVLRRQVHARSNVSFLYAFRRPRKVDIP